MSTKDERLPKRKYDDHIGSKSLKVHVTLPSTQISTSRLKDSSPMQQHILTYDASLEVVVSEITGISTDSESDVVEQQSDQKQIDVEGAKPEEELYSKSTFINASEKLVERQTRNSLERNKTEMSVPDNKLTKSDSQDKLPQTFHDRDLSISRKRKRQRKPDSTTRQSKSEVKDFDGFLKSNLSSNSRPVSRTSLWTMNSKQLGSNDSLHSFRMEDTTDNVEANSVAQQYSYLNSNATPISFKTVTMEGPTDIIDIEDDDADFPSDTEQKSNVFDPWLGVKPYNVTGSSNPNDSYSSLHGRPLFESGTSTSEIYTKQKLLYAKFARRPKSETILDVNGKPPLPPDVELRKRPASDTVRNTQYFSRYFSSDLDLHC